MRTFIALELPETFTSEAAALACKLKTAVEGRFLSRDTYHLTLAFLGELGETEAATTVAILEELCAEWHACAETHGILLRCDGLGKFGRANDATLWLSITSTPELEQLVARLREQLAARDVPFDTKSFKPHITLARRARIPKSTFPALAFPCDTEATTVTLFKSMLHREGATYKPLYSVNLVK